VTGDGAEAVPELSAARPGPAAGRVVILDDDPTGSQCAAGIQILLRPGTPDFPGRLRASGPAPVFVLTNTRALEPEQAARTVTAVREACAGLPGPGRPVCVLRGDSTLRGHIGTEMSALGLESGAGLIVPAFPAAGRVTLGGVHYVRVSGTTLVNAADTEFAADPAFGFRARTMPDWVRERCGDRPVTTIGLDRLRAGGPGTVRLALDHAADGGVVVPDVETDDDIALIADGFRQAVAGGRQVVLRCAAPLAALIAGTPGRAVAIPPLAGGLLVICGSHTAAASAQLAELARVVPAASDGLVVPTDALWGDRRAAAIGAVVAAAGEQLARHGICVVATERVRRPGHGSQADGATVMAGLMDVARALAPRAGAIIAKGGITSADLVTEALGASEAVVTGQLETGISLWDVAAAGGRRLPVAVVPGNVGDPGTLARLARLFAPA
jgi:uncharacterized protein YgbK (DUF1537 family)